MNLVVAVSVMPRDGQTAKSVGNLACNETRFPLGTPYWTSPPHTASSPQRPSTRIALKPRASTNGALMKQEPSRVPHFRVPDSGRG